MDITIRRETLLKPLQAVTSVVEKKQTLPILANVLLSVQKGNLLLTGTDLEISLVGLAPLEENLAESTTITVSARKLFDICRALPESALLRLTLEKNNLKVRANNSYFILNTLPAQDFPNFEDSPYASQFNLKQSSLKNLFTKTYFAMGQQDVRHYLNGTFLDIRSNTIKAVAADGHRLALTTIQDDNIGQVEAKMIIPRKSVLELMRLLNDSDQEATIFIAENRFRMVTSEYTFTSKLINAQYPDYSRLIPQGAAVAISDREMIKQALTRASILSNEKFRGVRFQFEQNKLRITANNADQEQAEEAVGLDYQGEIIEIGFEICFNVAYLLDVVAAITTKTIKCIFTDSNNGVLIEPTEGGDSLYVVMPMRL